MLFCLALGAAFLLRHDANRSVVPGSESALLAEQRVFFKRGAGAAAAAETVWVMGFGRSGSSLLQELIVEAAGHRAVFAVFEPCHGNDRLFGLELGDDPQRTAQCLERVLRCDFAHVEIRNMRRTREFQDGDLGALCRQASVRVFKTIAPAPTTRQAAVGVAPPGAKLVRIARDPRSVFASMHSQGWAVASTATAAELCRKMNVWHDEPLSGGPGPPLLELEFEALVTHAEHEVDRLCGFLGWPLSPQLGTYLRTNFSPPHCPEAANRMPGYGTCRTQAETEAAIAKWRHELTPAQQAAFRAPVCAETLAAYGYAA